jgi:hypothetical protein
MGKLGRRGAYSALAIGLAAAAGLTLTAAQPASPTEPAEPQRMTYTVKLVEAPLPPILQLGVPFTNSGPLVDQNGAEAGYTQGGCAGVSITNGINITCYVVQEFDGGQLHLGLLTPAQQTGDVDQVEVAVLGGTGRYRKVNGIVTLSAENVLTRTYRWTYELYDVAPPPA